MRKARIGALKAAQPVMSHQRIIDEARLVLAKWFQKGWLRFKNEKAQGQETGVGNAGNGVVEG